LLNRTCTPVYLRVSWALKGVLKRAVSNIFTLEVCQRFVQAEEKYSVLFPSQFYINQLGPNDLSPPAIDSVILKEPFPPEVEAPFISIDACQFGAIILDKPSLLLIKSLPFN
jgi:hypothetical protein